MPSNPTAPTDPAQIDFTEPDRPVRLTDPATSKRAAVAATAPDKLRASHRRVLQLFRRYGNMDDKSLFSVAKAEGWEVSDSGLRSRRSELSKPNMLRLKELAESQLLAAGIGRGAETEEDVAAAYRWAREILLVEGIRSPLWDTGRRVKTIAGLEAVVWGLAPGADDVR